jgi:hypothetical protein
LRQRRTIDALGAQDVDVIELGELFRRECLRRAEHHVTGIVHDDIEAALLGDDLRDRRVGRWLRADIELDCAQIDMVVAGEFCEIGDDGRVAALRLAHRGIDGVAGLGERIGGQAAEAARRAGDDNDLFHDSDPLIYSAEVSLFRSCRRWRAAPGR